MLDYTLLHVQRIVMTPGKYKICEECGKIFFKYFTSKYCSPECRRKKYDRRYRENLIHNKFKILYSRYKRSDQRKGRDNDLSESQIKFLIENKQCFYCGRKEDLGLDRINNIEGHTKNNVIVACRKCNSFRMNYLTVEETKKVIDFIKSFREW